MKYVPGLLIIAGLIAGAIAAATAYLAPLDLPSEELVGLTLNAEAGVAPPAVTGVIGAATAHLLASQNLPFAELVGLTFHLKSSATPHGLMPLVAKGDQLTAKSMAQLGESGVQYVRVKEFSFGRWPYRWLFLGGIAMMAGGALVGRFVARQARGSADVKQLGASPEEAIAVAVRTLTELSRDLNPSTATEESLRGITSRLTELQNTHFEQFISARDLLIERHGLAAYAELMDRFAAAERQVARAWSAAADNAPFEVAACLEAALERLAETASQLES